MLTKLLSVALPSVVSCWDSLVLQLDRIWDCYSQSCLDTAFSCNAAHYTFPRYMHLVILPFPKYISEGKITLCHSLKPQVN